jgi:pimeloyl-ACP methyl ester carboxylesterase
MPSKKGRSKPKRSSSLSVQQPNSRTGSTPRTDTVPFRWLAIAAGIAILSALACAWGTLCVLFWQGSWQLLYHPSAAVVHTPAAAGLAFESIGFASNAAGEPQLKGWWIPAGPNANYTAIYLHGADGNLGDAVSALTHLHQANLNVFAFDYRGYGNSHFKHPSEVSWLEDAKSAIAYLTDTRHVPVNCIVLVGNGLGANLALQLAAEHPSMSGVILDGPLDDPVSVIFNDSRSHLVPAHMLVRDRYSMNAPAANLHIPSLWFYWIPTKLADKHTEEPEAYRLVIEQKVLVWMVKSPSVMKDYDSALRRWLDELPQPPKTSH